MFGYVYTFESEGNQEAIGEPSVSVKAGRAIEAGINEHPGMRYQELTDPGNPRPMFAVLFAEPQQQDFFETLFQPALKLCGLRVAATRALVDGEIDAASKPDLGYIDRERGYAIFIPSLRMPLDGEPQT